MSMNVPRTRTLHSSVRSATTLNTDRDGVQWLAVRSTRLTMRRAHDSHGQELLGTELVIAFDSTTVVTQVLEKIPRTGAKPARRMPMPPELPPSAIAPPPRRSAGRGRGRT